MLKQAKNATPILLKRAKSAMGRESRSRSPINLARHKSQAIRAFHPQRISRDYGESLLPFQPERR